MLKKYQMASLQLSPPPFNQFSSVPVSFLFPTLYCCLAFVEFLVSSVWNVWRYKISVNRNSRQLCPNSLFQACILSVLQYRVCSVSPVLTYNGIASIFFLKMEYVRNSSLHGFILIWWSTLGETMEILSPDCPWKPASIRHPDIGLPGRCTYAHTGTEKSSPTSNSICLTYWTLQEHRPCDAVGSDSAVLSMILSKHNWHGRATYLVYISSVFLNIISSTFLCFPVDNTFFSHCLAPLWTVLQ